MSHKTPQTVCLNTFLEEDRYCNQCCKVHRLNTKKRTDLPALPKSSTKKKAKARRTQTDELLDELYGDQLGRLML